MRRVAQACAVGLVVALLGILVWQLAHDNAGRTARDPDKGKITAAPEFTRPRVDTTGTMSLASLTGKVKVINFWQSYCAPCTEEARTLAQSSERWKDKGVVFVGVDVQDLKGPALAFIKRFDIRYPIVSDGGPLVGRYGVTGYPETFFVTGKGCVVPPHIVGPASHEDLNRGIRNAMKHAQTSCGTET
jgi:cytochrome c biogenesis protein CcmG/thiol:disulfide interchange protein DsbE